MFSSLEELERFNKRKELSSKLKTLNEYQNMMNDNIEERLNLRQLIISSFNDSLTNSINNINKSKQPIFDLISEFHDYVINDVLSIYDEHDFIDNIFKQLK